MPLAPSRRLVDTGSGKESLTVIRGVTSGKVCDVAGKTFLHFTSPDGDWTVDPARIVAAKSTKAAAKPADEPKK
jgi:hypothetical protein